MNCHRTTIEAVLSCRNYLDRQCWTSGRTETDTRCSRTGSGSEIEIVEYGGVIQIRPPGKGVTLQDRGKGFVIIGDGTLTNEMVLELRDMDRR